MTQPTCCDLPERWAPIPDYEGYYEASDHGRIRSVDRRVRHSRCGTMLLRGKVLSPVIHRGRPHLTLGREGVRRQLTVHSLVLSAFRGPRPEGMEGCHGDNDKLNNHLANLRWDTTSANVLDQVQHGVHRNARKKRCPLVHLLVEPNLVPGKLRKGQRCCRACARARSALHQEGITDASVFPAVANAYYAAIMESDSASAPRRKVRLRTVLQAAAFGRQ